MRPLRTFLTSLATAAVTAGAVALAGPASAATGSIWAVQPTASPQAKAANFTRSNLVSVSASGPTEAWAAGTFLTQKALDQPLVEHFDGSTWTRVAVPQPAGQQVVLNAVDDLSPTDAWAVGTSFHGGDTATPEGRTLIEHWDGTAWSIVPSPNPATGVAGDADTLNAISGTSPTDIWAVGSDLNEATHTIQLLFAHWNGTAWTTVTSPTSPAVSAPFPSGITAISPDNVWAVGTNETGGQKTLAAHWNGTAWSIVPTPDIKGDLNLLTSVSSDSAGDVWAAGYAVDPGQNFRVPYVLHWTGTAWVMTKVPNPGTKVANVGGEGSALNGITVLSPTDAWAVGQTQGSNGAFRTLTEQFNGTTWTVVRSPDPGSMATGGLGMPTGPRVSFNQLDGVASAGGGNLFAVGVRATKGQEGMRTLAIATSQG
jgi:hypothetical protein